MHDARAAALARVQAALAVLPWAAIALGVVVYLFVPGGPDDPPARITVLLTLAAFFLAVLARLTLAAWVDKPRRVGLVVLGSSIALWALGSATVNAEQTIEEVAFPAPGEIACIAAYVGLAAFLMVDARPRRLSMAQGLEGIVVWGAAVCMSAFVLVLPVARSFSGDPLALVVAVLFPLINLVLAGVVLVQVVHRARERSLRSGVLAVGFLLIAVADSSFLVELADRGVYTTSVVLAVIWGLGFGLVVEGAVRRPVDVARTRRDTSPAVLLVAATLAVIAMVLSPPEGSAWIVRVPAFATLVATGWRLLLALREARGAAEALRLSLTDELTGLPNRRAVLQLTDHAIQHRGPVSVLLLDLDSFKDINDSLGHSVGDEVLLSLADRMREVVSGMTIARLGGDEFAVVVPSEDELVLFETAQEIRSALRRPLRVEGIDLSLDASVGIAVREEADSSAIEMLRRADIAMYEAKQSRAGVLLFDRAQDGMSHLRLLRGEALRQAIAEGQLIAWYQPQIDARTRQVVAMEALVRWWHPTEGLLPPIAFLPDARRSGLMPALTESLMLQVVADARRWRAAGFNFRVAMNWSPPELVSGQLLPRLFAAIDEAGLPADSILVEVTEDSFLSDPERARMVLHELRAHGVQVAIDDYGSGFSSLAYLRDLPVQELKMDRAFVAPVASDERSRMIVQTTTQMARALGLRFVAEGVEDAAAVGELVPLGVDVLQGYHIARPMPADAVGPWVRQWTEAHLASRPA